VVASANGYVDLQQYCYTNERLSTQFECHEFVATGMCSLFTDEFSF
jgi:hypothetical protein